MGDARLGGVRVAQKRVGFMTVSRIIRISAGQEFRPISIVEGRK